MEIRHQVDVARSPDVVFDFLADTDNFTVVDRALVSYEPRGVMRLGLSGTFRHRRGGMTARSTWRVDELERPGRIRVAVRGMGYELHESASLSATATGTRAAFVVTVRPTSIPGRLLVALSGGIIRRDLDQRARLMKAAIEARTGEEVAS